jgi:hypothetical protein
VTGRRFVVVGERVLRRRRAAAGVALLLFPILAVTVHLTGFFRDSEWHKQLPNFWLLRTVENASGPEQVRAFKELTRRIKTSELSGDSLDRLIELALRNQQGPFPRRVGREGFVDIPSLSRQLLGGLYEVDQLSAAQREGYLDQSIGLELHLRPRIGLNTAGTVRVVRHNFGPPGAAIATQPAELIVEGNPALTIDFHAPLEYLTGHLDELLPPELASEPGERRFELDVAFEIIVPGVSPQVLHSGRRSLSAVVQVLEGPEQVRMVRSPELDASVLSKVTMGAFEMKRSWNANGVEHLWYSGGLDLQPGAPALAFAVHVTDGAREWKGQPIHAWPEDVWTSSGGRSIGTEIRLFSDSEAPKALAGVPDRVTVILTPIGEPALRTVDIMEVWGGSLIFEDVPVSAGPPGQSTVSPRLLESAEVSAP